MSVLKCIPVVMFVAGCATSAFAFPDYLDKFKKDPFAKRGVDGCQVCHNSPSGGDDRNPFGQAFEAGAGAITPMLRAQFSDRFSYPTSKVSDTLTIHFSDPANKQVVVESGGTRALVDLEKRAVDGKPATAPGGPADAAAVPPPAAAPRVADREQESRSEIPGDRNAREGVFFGANVVNLPNGKPLGAGAMEFMIGHRFSQPAFQRSLDDLFGFDSFAAVTFGVRTGITNWLSASATRSNRYKTVEFAGTAQLARQGGTVPLSVQVRGGVEGQDNFREKYSPFLQAVATRSFGDRVSVLAAPTFAFKTREAIPGQPSDYGDLLFGDVNANHTISMGLGMGVRVLPTVTVVGEWIPRLAGFEGEIFSRPAVSFGLQKSTFRHTFQFVLSTAEPITTAQYAVRGTDTFKVGFNIYRKLR